VSQLPSVAPDDFRRAARRFAGAVCLATARHGASAHAVTATAFSLCLEPALIFVALDDAGQLISLAEAAGHVGVSVLGVNHLTLAQWASISGRPLALPQELVTTTALTGAPLIPDALAWFDGRIVEVLRFGDHAVVVAAVAATGSRPDGLPLLYVDRGYRAVGDLLSPGS